MDRPGVMIPLLGARNAVQLEDNLGALDVVLSEEQVSKLNEVSAIELGFPHDFLGDEAIRDIVFGGTFGEIDNHRGE
jgi:diketogulonate reductase-like aldo/keto reductase